MSGFALEVKDLRFSWEKSGPPLLQIDEFFAQRGEKIFLKGPSGSGKTTFLNLISGVLDPDAGKIRVLNHELTSMSRSERDRIRGDHLGFIFQMFNLIPYLSVLENILLPCEFSSVKKEKQSQLGDLDETATKLVDRLQLDSKKTLHTPVQKLSVGQQQRVAVARALIGQPQLIIADEPTSSLDEEAKREFLNLLFSECALNEITLLFVSHDGTLKDSFDRVIHLLEISGKEK